MTAYDRSYAFAVLVLCLAAILVRCAPPVEAQADTLIEDVVGLTFHEANGNLADADGIYAALVNGAARRGLTPHAYARIHSRRYFADATSRPWARAVPLDCSRPRGFHGSWSRRRDACVALVEHVRAIVESPPLCAAITWGSVRDHERARLRGQRFRIVECAPGSRNLFSLPAGSP